MKKVKMTLFAEKMARATNMKLEVFMAVNTGFGSLRCDSVWSGKWLT
jgi:hypothetical protein